jgi:hypothetical protein
MKIESEDDSLARGGRGALKAQSLFR